MVTKYDLFEVVYKNKNPIKPIEVVEDLNKTEKEYNNIHRLLTELEKNHFLIKTKFGFQAKRNQKTNLLYIIIHYCLANNINYNLLLNQGLVEFVKGGLERKELTLKNTQINPRTFTKYTKILDNNGLLLIISKKPLRIKFFYNSLIKNLLSYFNLEIPERRENQINYLDVIKKELESYKGLRRRNEAGFRKIVAEFEIHFIHHSLTLEGNPITLPDTIKILKNKIIPNNLRSEDVDEIKNYQNAILQMLKDSNKREPLTIQTILNYHALSMYHLPKIAGKIRKIDVHIKGNPNFEVSKPTEIISELNQLINEYNRFIKKKVSIKEIISFSSLFHNEFQHIHPFIDGNSRTSRLITFHLLQSKGIPVLDIPFGLLDEYLECTKGSERRDDKKLFETLQKIILFNLRKINERLSS